MMGIEDEFADLIRNNMTDREFWEWVGTWKDPQSICEQAEEWDIELKREEIKKIKKMFSRFR